MKKTLKLDKFFSLIFKNDAFRLNLSLFGGMILNFVYIAGNLASAFLYRNVWSATMTVYHSIFLLLRFYLITAKRRCRTDKEIRVACLRIGIFLLFLDLVATVMMIYTVRQGSPMKYSGLVLFGFVIYTVYSLSVSIRGVKKYSNDNQRLYFAARNMTLAAALLSVFNLQYSVLITLGASSYVISRIIAFSGFFVFFTIILLAVRLVVKSLYDGSKI